MDSEFAQLKQYFEYFFSDSLTIGELLALKECLRFAREVNSSVMEMNPRDEAAHLFVRVYGWDEYSGIGRIVADDKNDKLFVQRLKDECVRNRQEYLLI